MLIWCDDNLWQMLNKLVSAILSQYVTLMYVSIELYIRAAFCYKQTMTEESQMHLVDPPQHDCFEWHE